MNELKSRPQISLFQVFISLRLVTLRRTAKVNVRKLRLDMSFDEKPKELMTGPGTRDLGPGTWDQGQREKRDLIEREFR